MKVWKMYFPLELVPAVGFLGCSHFGILDLFIASYHSSQASNQAGARYSINGVAIEANILAKLTRNDETSRLKWAKLRKVLPSLKLTWPLKMVVSNRNLLFQGSIFRGYVSFREGKCGCFSCKKDFWKKF